MPVYAVITLARIFFTLKAVINAAVFYTAGRKGTGLIARTAIEAAAAFSPDLHGAKPTVEPAEREKAIRPVELAFHYSVLLFLRIAASLSISP